MWAHNWLIAKTPFQALGAVIPAADQHRFFALAKPLAQGWASVFSNPHLDVKIRYPIGRQTALIVGI